MDYQLEPNTSDVEASSGTSRDLDFYSTGFKFRGDGSEINANGVDYMYIAFGDMFVVSSNNVPGLAR